MTVLRASLVRTSITIAALALALASVLVPGSPRASRAQAPEQETASPVAAFAGTFALAGERRELRAMDDAINRVVDQLNLFIREIARGEIHRRITPEQRIRLDVLDARTVAISIDDWGPVRAVLGAAPRPVRGSSGEQVNLTLRMRDDQLVQHTQSPRGSRTNVFTLSADQERLHMQVRIASDQLPSDIRYRLTYRRTD